MIRRAVTVASVAIVVFGVSSVLARWTGPAKTQRSELVVAPAPPEAPLRLRTLRGAPKLPRLQRLPAAPRAPTPAPAPAPCRRRRCRPRPRHRLPRPRRRSSRPRPQPRARRDCARRFRGRRCGPADGRRPRDALVGRAQTLHAKRRAPITARQTAARRGGCVDLASLRASYSTHPRSSSGVSPQPGAFLLTPSMDAPASATQTPNPAQPPARRQRTPSKMQFDHPIATPPQCEAHSTPRIEPAGDLTGRASGLSRKFAPETALVRRRCGGGFGR